MGQHYCHACGQDDQSDRLETSSCWICGTCFAVYLLEEEFEEAN